MRTYKQQVQIITILTALLISIFTPCFSNEDRSLQKDSNANSTVLDISPKLINQKQLEPSISPHKPQDNAKIQKSVEQSTSTLSTNQQASVSADGTIKSTNNLINPQEKRKFIRFSTEKLSHPISLKTEAGTKLIDISRGGIALKLDNHNQLGDIFPVQIAYKNIKIDTQAKVISTTADRIGAEFIVQNEDVANQLLYLSVQLESDNNMLGRRINQ